MDDWGRVERTGQRLCDQAVIVASRDASIDRVCCIFYRFCFQGHLDMAFVLETYFIFLNYRQGDLNLLQLFRMSKSIYF